MKYTTGETPMVYDIVIATKKAKDDQVWPKSVNEPMLVLDVMIKSGGERTSVSIEGAGWRCPSNFEMVSRATPADRNNR